MGVQLMRVNSYIRRYYAAGAFALLAFGVLTVSFYRGSLSSVDLICVFMLFILVVLLLYKLISVHQEMEDRENKFLHKEKELVNKNQQLEQDLAEKIVELVELKNIKQELETAKEQVDGLNQEKQDLEEKITELYNNLYLLLDKEPPLCEELAVHEGNSLTTDDRIGYVQCKIGSLNYIKQSLEEKLENESHRLNKAYETICALQKQINKLEKEREDYAEHIEKILGHENELDNQIDDPQKSNSKLNEELTKKDEYAKEREALAEGVSKLEEELDRSNKELTKIKRELKEESKWIEDSLSVFDLMNEERDELLKGLNETRKNLDRESKELTNMAQRLKEENEWASEESSQLECMIVERDKKNFNLGKELCRKDKELTEITQKLKEEKEKNEWTSEESSQLECMIVERDKKNFNLGKELCRKDKELTEITQKLKEENEYVKKKYKGCESIIVERGEMRKELNEAYEELRESERLSSSMKEQLELQQNAIMQISMLLKYLYTLLSKEQEAKISEVIRSYNEEKGCDSIESDSDEGYDSMSPRSSSPMGNLDAIRLYGVLKDFAATLPVHYNL